MAYIGVSPSNGVRRVFDYTATAGQTSFSGSDNNSQTLSYSDSNFIDVFQNGVLLLPSDYTATTGTSVVLDTGATVSDSIQITVFDVFSVADTVSKADGGTFDGAVTLAGGVSGDVAFDTSTLKVDASNNRVGIGTASPSTNLHVSGGVMLDGITVIGRNQTSYASDGAEVLIDANASTPPLICQVGGSTKFSIDANGHVTMPSQPAFSTYASVASNLSLNANYTIAFDSPIYDNNSDFASNTFTAPVTGKYQLNLCVRLNQLDDATQYYMIQIATSNRTYQNIHGNSGYDADVNYMNVNFSVVADMDAGDTAIAKIDVPSLGTAQVDVDGQTIFSGFLVC